MFNEDLKALISEAAATKYADPMIDRYLAETLDVAVREKLEASRAKGRGGWWDQSRCDVEVLRQMLRKHVEKGDMIDAAVLAGMIYVRGIVDEPGSTNAS